MATTANATGIVFGDGTHQTTGNVISYVYDVSSSADFNKGYSIIRNPGNCVAYDVSTAFPAGVISGMASGGNDGGFTSNGNSIIIGWNTTTDRLRIYNAAISNWEITDTTGGVEVSNTYIDIRSDDPRDLYWSNTGHRLFILNYWVERIDQYNLTTNYDVTKGMSFNSTWNYNVGSVVGIQPEAIAFSNNGTKLYVLNAASNTNSVIHQFSLSTAWQANTATYDTISLNVNSQEPTATTFDFSPDGLNLYVLGERYATIFQYTLSSAWDISTATYSNKSKVVRYIGNGVDTGVVTGAPNDAYIYKLRLRSDGDGFYVYFTGGTPYMSHWTWKPLAGTGNVIVKTISFSGIAYTSNNTHIRVGSG
jgi:hypothetical protein